jgi:hypothetical protein
MASCNNAITASTNSGSNAAYFGSYPVQDGILNDLDNVRFSVGTGISNTNRRTSLYVSSSGLTVVGDGLQVSGSSTFTGSLGVTGSISVTSGSFSSSVVTNLGDTFTDVPEATKIVTLTSASYVALTPKDPNTLYVVTGSAVASPFPFNGKAEITGSVQLLGNLGVTGSAIISGSIIVTGSALGNVVSASIASSTASIDGNSGNFFTCLVTASTFFNVSGINPGETISILLTTVQGNGNAALPTASFSSNILQPSGSRYTPSSGSGAKDVLSLVSFDSTNALLVSAKKFI